MSAQTDFIKEAHQFAAKFKADFPTNNTLPEQTLFRLALRAPFLLKRTLRNPLILDEWVNSAFTNQELPPYNTPNFNKYSDLAEVSSQLRLWKYQWYLLLTAFYVDDQLDALKLGHHLSKLAEIALEAALQYAYISLAQSKHDASLYKLPVNERGQLIMPSILGMGKLGGGELNYSSDIDVIFVHQTNADQFATIDELPNLNFKQPQQFWQSVQCMTQLENHPGSVESFFCKVARLVIELIGKPSGQGFVFRVDPDLRPLGKTGQLSQSAESILNYYQNLGREWERVALIKARHVAGYVPLSNTLKEELRPFVYRKYMDYAAVESIWLAKESINLHHERKNVENIKLGHGGIRENEFFVQAWQLLYGGKTSQIRCESHQTALDELLATELFSAEDHHQISSDYWLLRKIENHLQMFDEQANYQMPQIETLRKAIFYDFAANFDQRYPQLEKELQETYRRNNERFKALGFNEADTGSSSLSNLPAEVRDDYERRLNVLKQRLMTTRMGERCLKSLNKLLHKNIIITPDNSALFGYWLSFFEQIGDRHPIYALLEVNERVLRYVSLIFKDGVRYTQHVIKHPEYLEHFIYSGLHDRQLSGQYTHADNTEDFLISIQRYKAGKQLEAVLQFIEGASTAQQSTLSDLADTVIDLCLKFSARSSESDLIEHIAIIGLGKLGSKEMRFGSDLDLMYIVEDDVLINEYKRINRLVRNINLLLTSRTQLGAMYEIDFRLRPFGRDGESVISLTGFGKFLDKAELWNFQAYSRIRTVAGNHDLGERVIHSLHQGWLGRNFSIDTIRHAIQDMLQKLIDAHDPQQKSIKYSGLLPVEFLTQFQFLSAACAKSFCWQKPNLKPLPTAITDAYATLSHAADLLYLHNLPPIIDAESFKQTQSLAGRLDASSLSTQLLELKSLVSNTFSEHA